MPISNRTQALMLALYLRANKRNWQAAAVSMYQDFWGPQPKFERGAFSRKVLRFRRFVRQCAKYQKANSFAPHLKSELLIAFPRLQAAVQLEKLPTDARSLLSLLMIFYGLESGVKHHLQLVLGLMMLSLGEVPTPALVFVDSETRKLRSIESTLGEIKKRFTALTKAKGTRRSVGPIRELISSVSTKLNSTRPRLGLVDVRNAVGHDDFEVFSDGRVRIGHNVMHREHKSMPRWMSPKMVDQNLDRVNGLLTMLAAWRNLVQAVAGAIRPPRAP
jgi:hypothetical protein